MEIKYWILILSVFKFPSKFRLFRHSTLMSMFVSNAIPTEKDMIGYVNNHYTSNIMELISNLGRIW